MTKAMVPGPVSMGHAHSIAEYKTGEFEDTEIQTRLNKTHTEVKTKGKNNDKRT